MKYQLDLPIELEPYRNEFSSSIISFIKIEPQPATDTSLWQSKIGGVPYLPKDIEFPKGSNGEKLFLLAQFNFSEIPALKNFPEKGILQFYISDKGNYGLDYEVPDEQHDFRVLFFEDIITNDKLLNVTQHPIKFDDLPIDPNIAYPLKFSLNQEAVPLSDHNIHDYLPENFFARFGAGQWEVMNGYSKMVNSRGHKMGGYAFFTQEDVRYEMGEYELLFQLDSDQSINCQWGDMGVANFFIKKEDLINRDFSKVLYNWDCY